MWLPRPPPPAFGSFTVMQSIPWQLCEKKSRTLTTAKGTETRKEG